MNFQRGKQREDPEINLIPMIDVLLVILIFLMVTTTFSQIAELQINLPQADAEQPADKPAAITVAVDVAGRYMINATPLADGSVETLNLSLRRAAGDRTDPVIVINADANTPHQAVINVMEAARLAGFSHITFATQARPKK